MDGRHPGVDGVLHDPALGAAEWFLPWTGLGNGAGVRRARTPRRGRAHRGFVITIDKHIHPFASRTNITTLDHICPEISPDGDPHIGQHLPAAQRRGRVLHWQVARRGNWSLDLGYFLEGALTVEDRRRSERALLEEYLESLRLPEPSCRRSTSLVALPGVGGTRADLVVVHRECRRALAAPRHRFGTGSAVLHRLADPDTPSALADIAGWQ